MRADHHSSQPRGRKLGEGTDEELLVLSEKRESSWAVVVVRNDRGHIVAEGGEAGVR